MIALENRSFSAILNPEVVVMSERSFPGRSQKIAVFSDIHSNYYAFKACFEDARLHGADCFIFLGDYISDLADPGKTLDLVYEIRSQYPTVCLRGNRERYMLDHEKGATTFSRGSKTGSLLYTFDQLRAQDFDFMKALPIYDVIEINGIPFEIGHSIKDDDRYYFEKEDSQIQRAFVQMECAYLLTGHSHKQYIQSCQGKTIINPGSIGVPRGYGYLAQYALLEVVGQSVRCGFRQIPYDLRAAIRSQFASGLVDYAKYWAISILYDVITGEEYAIKLLTRVHQRASGRDAGIHDENLWHSVAAEMGMKFTEKEIIDFLKTRI